MPSSDSEDYGEKLVQNDAKTNVTRNVKKIKTQSNDISRAQLKQNLLDGANVMSKKNFLQKMLGDSNAKVKELMERRLSKGILKRSPKNNASTVSKYKSNSFCEDTSDSDTQTKRNSISKNNSHNSKNDSRAKSDVRVPSESSGFESFSDTNERNAPTHNNKYKRISDTNIGKDAGRSSDGSGTSSGERDNKKKIFKSDRSKVSDSESYSDEDVSSPVNKTTDLETSGSEETVKKTKKAVSLERDKRRKREEISSSESDSEKTVKKPKKAILLKRDESGKRLEASSSESDFEKTKTVKKPKNVILLERNEKFSISNQIRITPLKPSKNVLPSQKLLDTFATENELTKAPTKTEWLLNLTPDDEIFSVQIPKSLQVQLLIDNLVPLNGQAKFKIQKDTYVWDASVDDDLPCVDLIAPIPGGNYAIKKVKPKGAVVVHRHFKIKHRPIELKPSEDTIDVPTDLKLRHPLFGVNYEDKISLDERVVDKLNNVKRKKKRKRVEQDHIEQNHVQQIPVVLDELPRKKKKKKRSKDVDEVDVSQDTTKHMKNVELDEANFDIFKLLNDYTLDRKVHNSKKKKKDRNVDVDVPLNDTVSELMNDEPKVKKKKKRSKDIDVSQIKPESIDLNDSLKKHKNKKGFFITNSTMMSPSCSTFNNLDESLKDRKKKKRKSKDENPEFLNFIDGLVKEVDDNIICDDVERKRKKKKKHSHKE